ncbi:MAG: tetratricopeptide repeat protein [Anaerolineaceae bacterium]|nr:MAG: tetratricopeptide repeat protein [Anaerolineaceae bacterium]
MADNLKGHVNTNRETTASDSAKSDQDQLSESTMEVSTFTEPEAKSRPEETASLEEIKQEKQDMPARKQQMEETPMTTKKIPHTAHEFTPVTNLSEDQLAVDSIENEDELTEIRNPEVWNEKGNIHFQQGDYDKAIAAYNKAIELDLSFGWPYSNLALTYLTLGKFAEAILLYQKSADLLQKQEEQAASWNSIGNIYRHLNDYQGALNAYQKADDLDPQNAGKREKVDPAVSGPNSSNAQVWIELGNLFFKSASYSEAVNAYTNAVKLDPSSGWAQSNLAMSLVYQGKYKEAIPVYLKSIELFTDDKDKAASWNRLGNVYRKLNDESSAMKAYQTAVILSDEKTDLLTRTRFSLLSNCYTS